MLIPFMKVPKPVEGDIVSGGNPATVVRDTVETIRLQRPELFGTVEIDGVELPTNKFTIIATDTDFEFYESYG